MRRALAAGVIGWVLAAVALDQHGERSVGAASADLVVVAGCRVEPDGTASPCLRGRVERAAALWREGRAPIVLLTGGVGEHPPSEAEAGRAVLLAAGVPADRIALEDRSSSTEENAVFARRVTDARRVLLVTDTFHVWRAERVFGRVFDEVSAVGVRAPWWPRTRGALREVAAVGWYGLRGRLAPPAARSLDAGRRE